MECEMKLNINSQIFEVGELISNYIPHFTGRVYFSKLRLNLIKGDPGQSFIKWHDGIFPKLSKGLSSRASLAYPCAKIRFIESGQLQEEGRRGGRNLS